MTEAWDFFRVTVIMLETFLLLYSAGLFLSKRYGKHHWLWTLVGIVLSVGLRALLLTLNLFEYTAVCYFLFDTVLVGLLFRGSRKANFIIFVVFYYLVVFLSEALSTVMVSLVIEGYNIGDLAPNNSNYILVNVLAKLLLMVIIICVARSRTVTYALVPMKQWRPILLIPIISIGLILVVFRYNQAHLQEMVDLVIIILVCVVLLNVLNLMYYLTLVRGLYESARQIAAEQYREGLKNQLALLGEYSNTIKSQVHDLRHVFNNLRTLYPNIAAEIDIMEKRSKKNLPIITGNLDIDNILLSQRKRMADAGVQLFAEGLLPENLRIDVLDLFQLLTNALENAMEGCLRIDDATQEKNVKVKLSYRQTGLFCEIINQVNPEEDFKFPLRSTKKDKQVWHGFGLKNMQTIVDQYHGQIDYQAEDGIFRLAFHVPNQAKTSKQ